MASHTQTQDTSKITLITPRNFGDDFPAINIDITFLSEVSKQLQQPYQTGIIRFGPRNSFYDIPNVVKWAQKAIHNNDQLFHWITIHNLDINKIGEIELVQILPGMIQDVIHETIGENTLKPDTREELVTQYQEAMEGKEAGNRAQNLQQRLLELQENAKQIELTKAARFKGKQPVNAGNISLNEQIKLILQNQLRNHTTIAEMNSDYSRLENTVIDTLRSSLKPAELPAAQQAFRHTIEQIVINAGEVAAQSATQFDAAKSAQIYQPLSTREGRLVGSRDLSSTIIKQVSADLTDPVSRKTLAQKGTQLELAKKATAPDFNYVEGKYYEIFGDHKQALKAATAFENQMQSMDAGQAFIAAGRSVDAHFDRLVQAPLLDLQERATKAVAAINDQPPDKQDALLKQLYEDTVKVEQGIKDAALTVEDNLFNFQHYHAPRIYLNGRQVTVTKVSHHGIATSVEDIQTKINLKQLEVEGSLFSRNEVMAGLLGDIFIPSAQHDISLLEHIDATSSIYALDVYTASTMETISQVKAAAATAGVGHFFGESVSGAFAENQTDALSTLGFLYPEAEQVTLPDTISFGNETSFHMELGNGLGGELASSLFGQAKDWALNKAFGGALGALATKLSMAIPGLGQVMAGIEVAKSIPIIGGIVSGAEKTLIKLGKIALGFLGGLALAGFIKLISWLSSVAGSLAGLIGGAGGAFMGASIGAAAGSLLGPVGTLVGGVAGGIMGAITGANIAKGLISGAATPSIAATGSGMLSAISGIGGGASYLATAATLTAIGATAIGTIYSMQVLTSAFVLPPYGALSSYQANLPKANLSCNVMGPDGKPHPITIPEGFANGWPVQTGDVTAGDGVRTSAISVHNNAIDIGLGIGQRVFATHNGTVIKASWDNTGYGNLVKIQGNIGGKTFTTYYAHLASISVEESTEDKVVTVTRGQQIGTVNHSGNSYGDHLHYELNDAQYFPNIRIACTLPISDRQKETINSQCLFNCDISVK